MKTRFHKISDDKTLATLETHVVINNRLDDLITEVRIGGVKLRGSQILAISKEIKKAIKSK